jgi:hypothetical protein
MDKKALEVGRRISLLAILVLAVLLAGCGPGRYEVREGEDVARVRFSAAIREYSNRHVEYDMIVHDGDTCSAIGKVDLERYVGPLFGGDKEAAKDSFVKSALPLGMPRPPAISESTIVKEKYIAAGKPIVVVANYRGPPNFDTHRRLVCSAETRFTPEKGVDYSVEFSMLSSERCSMNVDRLVQTPEGPKWRGINPVGKGCIDQ